jgi:hypothetical protein
MTLFKLTLLKTTSPFMLGARCMRIDGGKLRMNQMMTAENFDNVMEGMDMSIPLTMSPSKSGNDNWLKQVAKEKLVTVSALKH